MLGRKVVDPVCGMRIRKREAVATLEHEGETYYFCSEMCKEEFIKDPMKYMGSEHQTKNTGRGCGCCH
jgi:Cu+-exporting ATPase